ncbi:MAG: CNT family concentrative nucleoside transporter [Bacteroidia bacterium]|jgi:CNT family concentrative nucleoside transporter
MEILEKLIRGSLGLAFFCLVAWFLSSDRKRFPWRVVFAGLGMQFALAGLILGTETGRRFFETLAGFFAELVNRASAGPAMVFGPLAGSDLGFIFAFAGTGLPIIVFFSALMAILYHIGVMQVLVYYLARIMSKLLRVSGAESMAMAANIFVGQTEAPLVVKPYIGAMTKSELNALMTGGFATIAGSVLAVYLTILGPEIGPHLLTASVMSAPAAFLIAKIMVPETELSATGGKIELKIERNATNLLEAAANGTADGLKLWLNVIAMLIAFVGLVALINWPLEAMSDPLNPVSISTIFGYVLAPIAWLMGIESWHDCQLFGSLLGIKVAVNEFVAMGDLQVMAAAAVETSTGQVTQVFENKRSAVMAAYALCGFANFASIGIQLGGIASLAPERKTDLAKLAMKAMLGGAFASWMTATVAGIFISSDGQNILAGLF